MENAKKLIIMLAVGIILIFAIGFNKIISYNNNVSDPPPVYSYTGANASPADTALMAFDFSKSLQGWSAPDFKYTNDQALSNAVLNTVTGNNGTGCIQMDANFDSTGNSLHAKGDLVYNIKAALDLSRRVITAWVFVPPEIANASSYSAAIFIRDTSSHYSAGGSRGLYMAGWTEVTCAVSNMTGNADAAKVGTVGIQVYREIGTDDMMKDVSGVQFLFDNISF